MRWLANCMMLWYGTSFALWYAFFGVLSTHSITTTFQGDARYPAGTAQASNIQSMRFDEDVSCLYAAPEDHAHNICEVVKSTRFSPSKSLHKERFPSNGAYLSSCSDSFCGSEGTLPMAHYDALRFPPPCFGGISAR